VHVGDGQGHGPDLGSAEWMSVVEKRLGFYQQADVPEPGTPEWCARVDEALGFGAAEYALARLGLAPAWMSAQAGHARAASGLIK